MMEDWKPEEWQGKRRNQVEFSYKAAAFSMLCCIIIIIFALL